MKIDRLKIQLKLLKRKGTEEIPSASVSEAIETLINCCEYLLNNQPERLSEKTIISSESTK